MPRRRTTLSTLFSTLLPMLGILAGVLAMSPLHTPAAAQEAAVRPEPISTPASSLTRLPDDKQSSHLLVLPNRALRFTATAGAIPVGDEHTGIRADLAFVAYTLNGTDPRTRPVAFAFNGGPGSASTWLHLGAMGPWRVPLTSATIAAKGAPELVDNAETWLDFTDLVFIDPPGTGFSRIWPTPKPAEGQPPAANTGPAWFWSQRGDVTTFGHFVQAWAKRFNRQVSPVVLVGESYGGFRAPLIADNLTRERSTPVSAMVLVSPVLDFDGRRGGHLPQHYVGLLPSLAATRQDRSGSPPSSTSLAEVEAYARGEYMLDLMRGARDNAAVDRISAKVAGFTGLDVERVRIGHGRLAARDFLRGIAGAQENTISLYDAGMTGFDPIKSETRRGFSDPFIVGLYRPLTAAMGAIYDRLGWKTDRPYVMHSNETNQGWVWRNSPHAPESLSTLQMMIQSDRRLRSLVVHGYTDLVTPYFATALQLDQLASHGPEQRIKLKVYAGGHMFYSHNDSRARFRADAAQLLSDALPAGARRALGETKGEASE